MPYVNVEILKGSALSVGPNHREPLELTTSDRSKRKGASPCPVSKVLFEWEQDPQGSGTMKDKNGNLVQDKSFIVTGDD